MNGTHASSNVQTPHLLNIELAFSMILCLKGNQALFLKLMRLRPNIQFKTAPSTLPIVAITTSQKTSYCWPVFNAASSASDCAGNIVAERKAPVNSKNNPYAPLIKAVTLFLKITSIFSYSIIVI